MSSTLDDDAFPELEPDRYGIRAGLRQLTKRLRASNRLPEDGYYEQDEFE